MVTFSCEVSSDLVFEPSLDHSLMNIYLYFIVFVLAMQRIVGEKKIRNHRCRPMEFTCIDCNRTFYGQEYNSHNQCISEAENMKRERITVPKLKGMDEMEIKTSKDEERA